MHLYKFVYKKKCVFVTYLYSLKMTSICTVISYRSVYQ